MQSKREWHAEHSFIRDRVELVVIERHSDELHVGAHMQLLMKHQDTSVVSDPTVSLPREDMQQIMNELWRIGMRPNNGAGGVAHVEAIEAHLADMRRLVFHNQGIDL